MRGKLDVLLVVVGCALGCTQVHLLGQAEDSAVDADASDSSEPTGTGSGSTDSSTESGDELEGSEESSSTDTMGETGETETTGETGDDPVPEACQVVDLGGTDGLLAEIMLMTQWDEGACHLVELSNDTDEDVIWTRDLRFGGVLDNYWNAEAEELTTTDWRFGGQASASNIVVLAGGSVEFGICMACEP